VKLIRGRTSTATDNVSSIDGGTSRISAYKNNSREGDLKK
jgi:hypothetical protein